MRLGWMHLANQHETSELELESNRSRGREEHGERTAGNFTHLLYASAGRQCLGPICGNVASVWWTHW